MDRKEKRKVIVMEARPKSFKIHRKSSTASRLKSAISAISAELHRFLDNRSDDIFAEYITVLICNGKHQYQARDDLDAFLGERSGEFVSWLWEFLSRYVHETDEGTSSMESKDAIAVKDYDVDEERNSRFDRSRNGNKMPVKDKKNCLLLSSTGNPVPCNDLGSTDGFQPVSAPSPGLNNWLLSNRIETLKNDCTTSEIANHSLAFDSPVKRSPAVLPASHKQNVQQLEIIKKIVQSNCNVMPKREVFSRDLQSSIAEYPTSRQTCFPKVSIGGQSQTAVGSVFQRIEKPQGSVWDRLGKPRKDIQASSQAAILHDAGLWKQEVLTPHTANSPLWTGEVGQRTPRQFPRLDNRSYGSNLVQSTMSEVGANTICPQHTARNIRGKRPFNEISNCPSVDFVSSADEKNMNILCRETSQDLKKPNLTEKNPKNSPHLISEVIDMKQRLCLVEMEMLKIRAKQMEKENDGKTRLLSNPGLSKHPAGDIESRTVVVSNVHVAATWQALKLYFSKCGVAVYVVILVDKEIRRSNRSAYVTFASQESVDKAIALSGSTFFSRTLKVQRKAEANFPKSEPTQCAGKLSSATVSSYAEAEQKRVESSMQQLPTSVASEKNKHQTNLPRSCVNNRFWPPRQAAVSSSAEKEGVESYLQQLPTSVASEKNQVENSCAELQATA